MTAPAPDAATAGRLPPASVAALAYALRVCVPTRRWALLAVPGAAAVLLGLLARAVEDAGSAAAALAATSEGTFALVIPLACLIVGDAVLGAEIRSGTFTLTWLSPLRVRTVVVTRWLAGWLLASLVLVPAVALAALAAGAPGAAAPLVLATLAGTAAYIAVFVLIGATVQRAALWSLAFVLLVERLLGGVLAGIAQLSPQWLTTTAYAGWGPDAGELLRSGVPAAGAAAGRLAIITLVALALAVWRVRHLRLAGSTD